MMKSFFAILLILSATLAYVPVVPSVVRVSSSSLKMGYVPDGLTAEEYEMIKAQKEKAVAERKQKFKNKTYEDLSEWLKKRDAKYPGQPGAGHTFAKVVDRTQDLSEWLKKRDAKYPGQPGAGHTFAKVVDRTPKNPDFSKNV
eukprot:CAMPEP_0171480994 /NCGR_PEP_ID=MMETSP0946-20130122/6443_1 /TAXON_ID=109269 /ORGANISM="Vaucheria litorea, Strain CCMP2940" /LENGTH=142 /DNA_ID=CAMNT_0012012405 /DNA_START=90 /DNA_END=518 /DNA_ORIENTATION=-